MRQRQRRWNLDSGTLEIGQCAAGEGDGMAESEQYPACTRSLDSLGELRLTALLGDLMGEQGKTQAAETLGVSPRTLTRYEESRRLTPTLVGALERHLLEGGGSAAAQQQRQMRELGGRVARLEAALVEGLEELRKEGETVREEQDRALAGLEKRVAALEAAGGNTAGVPEKTPAGSGAGQPKSGASGKSVVERPRRVYPDLVTAEAEPGEELVYGDAAMAVVVRWREARDAVGKPRDALNRLNARQRWYELEIELIEQHELTLPPATRSWDWGDRRQEVRRRNEALDEIMVDHKMLRLRRFLTFGLWRK